jgi:DNA (cytosine-5)-methyltransferase 1
MKVVDLFAGCGGLSQGFLDAGFDVVAAFDNWKKAIDVYQLNFNHPIHEVDLSEVGSHSKIASYNPDIIIGGPPCQDFSSAGKRDESLGRADLTISFAQIIKEVTPKFFVMENVARILKSQALQDAMRIFREAGYGLSYTVLDASYCGVPQARKRFIMVGELGGEDDTIKHYLDKNLSEKQMTIRDYMGDELDIEHYYRHPRNYNRRGVFSIDEPSPTVRGVSRPIPSGYKGHSGDTAPISSEVRELSEYERSRIQTFPKNFQWVGSKTAIAQLLGNAVPVNLGKYVAECIKEYQENK